MLGATLFAGVLGASESELGVPGMGAGGVRGKEQDCTHGRPAAREDARWAASDTANAGGPRAGSEGVVDVKEEEANGFGALFLQIAATISASVGPAEEDAEVDVAALSLPLFLPLPLPCPPKPVGRPTGFAHRLRLFLKGLGPICLPIMEQILSQSSQAKNMDCTTMLHMATTRITNKTNICIGSSLCKSQHFLFAAACRSHVYMLVRLSCRISECRMCRT